MSVVSRKADRRRSSFRRPHVFVHGVADMPTGGQDALPDACHVAQNQKWSGNVQQLQYASTSALKKACEAAEGFDWL